MKWRVNFTVLNSNYNLVCYAPNEFVRNIPKKDGVQLFKEWYLVHEKGSTSGYIPIQVLSDVANWIKYKIISDPEWADNLHKETEKDNWDYFNYAKSIVGLDFSSLTNQDLAKLYEKLKAYQLPSHVRAIATTWFLDSDGEVFSNYLKERLQNQLQTLGISDPIKLIEYFTILTSPTKTNFAQEEQLDFLRLLKNPSEENIKKHYEKWCWTPYGYIGPAYDLNHYVIEVQNNLSISDVVDDLIAEETIRHEKLKIEQDKLIKEIQLPKDLQHYFAIAREIIWLKDFRKYTIWYGHYVLDKITKEIAKRLQISHRQANYFFTEEIEDALLKGIYNEQVLNERFNYSVIWADENETKIYYGDEARKIIKNLDLENIETGFDNGFKGTCAFPGKALGKVKIVNSVEEINKVEQGDIMLSITTYPALLPAMKKASAIVTEDGGITCHTAIVAREMKIPCVVGAKKVTQILSDGDIVEVDATIGMITKVS